jgi:hypothetical protein
MTAQHPGASNVAISDNLLYFVGDGKHMSLGDSMGIVSMYFSQLSFGLVGQLTAVIEKEHMICIGVKQPVLSQEFTDDVAVELASNEIKLFDLLGLEVPDFAGYVSIMDNGKFDGEYELRTNVTVGLSKDTYKALSEYSAEDRDAVRAFTEEPLDRSHNMAVTVQCGRDDVDLGGGGWQKIFSMSLATTTLTTSTLEMLRRKSQANASSYSDMLKSLST